MGYFENSWFFCKETYKKTTNNQKSVARENKFADCIMFLLSISITRKLNFLSQNIVVYYIKIAHSWP